MARKMRFVCALSFLKLACGLYLTDVGKSAENFIWKGDGGAWEQNGTILDSFYDFVGAIKRQNGRKNAIEDETRAKIKPATDENLNREQIDDFRRRLDEMRKKIGGEEAQILHGPRRVAVEDIRGNILEKDMKGADIPKRPAPKRDTRSISETSSETPDKQKNRQIDDHLSEIKEEVKKLQDLVQILRDQQYILSLLSDAENDTNTKPKISTIDNSHDSHPKNETETRTEKPPKPIPPNDDLDDVRAEIEKLKKLIKNNLLKKLESDEQNEKLEEEKITKELEDQKREILYLKKMISKFSKSSNDTATNTLGTRQAEGESAEEIEHVLKTIGDIQDKLNTYIHKKSVGDLLNATKRTGTEPNDLVGATKSDDLFDDADDAAKRLKRLEKELKIMAKSQRIDDDVDDDDGDLSSFLKQLDDDGNVPDEDSDLKEMLRKLQKQVDKNKKHEDSDRLKRLEKLMQVSEGKKKRNDEKQLMTMLKKLQKQGKNLDDEDDPATRLKQLQVAIEKLKPKEDEDEPVEDNFEAMLEKLVSQENSKISPSITKHKLTRKQMANITKKLETMVDNQVEEIAKVPTRGCEYRQNGNGPSGTQFTNYRYINDPYWFGNQFGYPTGGVNYEQSQNYVFGPVPPVKFPHNNQYGPSYPHVPTNYNYLHPNNFPNQNNIYNQPNQFPTYPNRFFQAFHSYGQNTGHEELPPEAYKSNANFDQPAAQQHQINPQQNSQNGDLYPDRRIGDLKGQIYDLQNAINTLNQPEYVKKPEDKVIIYNLDRQMTDLKSIVNNLGRYDDYPPNFGAQNYPSQTNPPAPTQKPVQNYQNQNSDDVNQSPHQDLNQYYQKTDNQKDVDDQKQSYDYGAIDYQSIDQNQSPKYERSNAKSKKQKRSTKNGDENSTNNNLIDSSALNLIFKQWRNEITKENLESLSNTKNVPKPHANLFDELATFLKKMFKKQNLPKTRSERDVDGNADLASILSDIMDEKSNEIDDESDEIDDDDQLTEPQPNGQQTKTE